LTTGSSGSSAASRRIAAIDVGTNSIRLIIAEASPDGSYRILDDEKETARLGQGMEKTGQISVRRMEQSLLTLARMKSITDGFGVEAVRAIGTSAVREASNREEFLRLARERAGLNVEPITAEEEADLAHLSVAHAFDLQSLTAAVVDLGGGSMEVVLSSGGVVETIFSLPLGAVRLTEQFGGSDHCARDRYEDLRRAVQRRLQRTIGKPPFLPQVMFGTGGTFTTLANMSIHRNQATNGARSSRPGVRGYEMKRSEVLHLMDTLRAAPPRARARIPGLSAERSEIIVAGATVVERVMKHLAVNRLVVHDGGIRDGLLLTMVRELFPSRQPVSTEPLDRMRAIRQFAASCGYEERHAEHVARLAGQIFDELAQYFPSTPGGWSDPGNRQLLEVAALLRDVGYLINYSKHHQHSYHLIIHSDLPGFSQREIELIANIARYHRRAAPKRTHPEFAALAKNDRELVRRLTAILRIADGLDRNRLQNVRRVHIRVGQGTACFVLEASEDPAVDIWGALRKARLFEKLFGIKARFEWQLPPVSHDGTAVIERGHG
jgi:exopolyphosphatase/guanosine-5'-triphosphate,3'-diphosphate pyrophosphatase